MPAGRAGPRATGDLATTVAGSPSGARWGMVFQHEALRRESPHRGSVRMGHSPPSMSILIRSARQGRGNSTCAGEVAALRLDARQRDPTGGERGRSVAPKRPPPTATQRPVWSFSAMHPCRSTSKFHGSGSKAVIAASGKYRSTQRSNSPMFAPRSTTDTPPSHNSSARRTGPEVVLMPVQTLRRASQRGSPVPDQHLEVAFAQAVARDHPFRRQLPQYEARRAANGRASEKDRDHAFDGRTLGHPATAAPQPRAEGRAYSLARLAPSFARLEGRPRASRKPAWRMPRYALPSSVSRLAAIGAFTAPEKANAPPSSRLRHPDMCVSP